jgi:hypothetical protein
MFPATIPGESAANRKLPINGFMGDPNEFPGAEKRSQLGFRRMIGL